jgi:hypothetical protein
MFRLFFADNSVSPFTIPWAAIRPSGRNSTPVLLFVDPSMRLVITKCWGEVSRDEVAHSLDEPGTNQDFKPDFRQMVDLSLV